MKALLSILGCRFPFIILNISCHSWPAEFLVKNQLIRLRGFPGILFAAFPSLLLIFFLCILIFVSFITLCLGMFHLEFIPYGSLCTSWI